MDLTLPSWQPGAYKIVDHARNVRNFQAAGADGAPLRFERQTKQTWRVFDGGAGATVRYELFGRKMEIHQNYLDDVRALINSGATFMYPQGGQSWPCEVAVAVPAGWRIATGLALRADGIYTAPTYDDLMDSPFLCGNYHEGRLQVGELDLRVAIDCDEPLNEPFLVGGLAAITQVTVGLWGDLPIKDYLYIFLKTPADYLNGLEHKNSTVITGPIDDEKRAQQLFVLAAHELVHVWNVKRLRPVGLGPFDFTREAHTPLLWIAEGFTEYYAELVTQRAGLASRADFLRGLADTMEQLEASPGRHKMTIEEASWTTWHFGDDRWNAALNYYLKGSLIGMALDLEIRHRTGNKASLDDVMRLMWTRYGATDTPYTNGDFERAAEEVAGPGLDPFFVHYVRGKEPVDWARFLGYAGLKLAELKVAPSLHLRATAKEGLLHVDDVSAAGAAEAAGLMHGDLLVALGERRATDSLLKRLGEFFVPGSAIPVTYLRRDRLRQTTLTLAGKASYSIDSIPKPDPLQHQILNAWLPIVGPPPGRRRYRKKGRSAQKVTGSPFFLF